MARLLRSVAKYVAAEASEEAREAAADDVITQLQTHTATLYDVVRYLGPAAVRVAAGRGCSL